MKELISWNSDDYDGTFCDESTAGLVNAAFCEDDNTIGGIAVVMMPSLRQANGDMAITMVLAHEYGHAIQKLAKLNKRAPPPWSPSNRPIAWPGCTCAGWPRATRRASPCPPVMV